MTRKKKPLPLPDGSTIGRSVRAALAALGLGDAAPPTNKYHNQPVVVDGIRFASKREARRWLELRELEKAGVIRNLRRQVKYPLSVNGQLICTYIGDFSYVEAASGREHLEDAKGVRTAVYLLKRRLLLALRGIRIEEI